MSEAQAGVTCLSAITVSVATQYFFEIVLAWFVLPLWDTIRSLGCCFRWKQVMDKVSGGATAKAILKRIQLD